MVQKRTPGVTMLAALALSLALALSTGALGQWSDDAASNFVLADRTGEQVQPKIVATCDGGAYVSWFDNATGGYDVYLQRLDGHGFEAWPHNGVLIADRSFSSTQDYDLAVDSAGYAVIVYRDDRLGGVQVGANRVAPDGTLVWGAGGVVLTNTTQFIGNIYVAATTTGDAIVGWSQNNDIALQKLNPAGVPQWPAGGLLLPAPSGRYVLSDLIPAEDGSVIAYWVRWTGTQIFSNKHLYAQKILSDGTLQGAGPTVVFDANSVQNGYFPTGSSDSEGGAVFSWYETGGSRLAYAQRVDTDGIELWPHGGVSGAVPDPGKIAIGSAAAYNAATGETFLFWPTANSNQSQWAVYGQKLLADGTRAWGDTGVEYVPFSTNQPSNLQVVLAGDGAIAVYSDRSGAAQLIGIQVDGNGAPTGAPLVVSSTLSGKSRLQAARTRGGTTLLAWSDSRSGAGDILVQNVNADGTLGLPVVIPGDVNCDGAVNFGDISPFIAAIKAGGPDQWPGPCPYASGDLNADGVVNFSDIAPFISALKAWPHCP